MKTIENGIIINGATFELVVEDDYIGRECMNCDFHQNCYSLCNGDLLCDVIKEGAGISKDGCLFKKVNNQKQNNMQIDTKFNVGDTVYFLNDNKLYKGVVKQIIINIDSSVLEIYEVAFINRDNEESKKDIGAEELIESAKDLFDNLMLNFSKSEKENE